MLQNYSQIEKNSMTYALQEIMTALLEEVEFQWLSKKYQTYSKGPLVKVALANIGLDDDIWPGLKNPAGLGLYPLGLPDIWDYYAYVTASKFDKNGKSLLSPDVRSFSWAKDNFQRAVLVSVMFPVAEEPLISYYSQIKEGKHKPVDYYSKLWELMNKLLEKAMNRLAFDMLKNDRVPVALSGESIKDISAKALPVTKQGDFHGPSKGGNFPHKSLAALTGLGQFGINRLIIRDEIINEKVERFLGPIRSMIIFDSESLDRSMVLFEDSWINRIKQINNFCIVEERNDTRFCTYTSKGGCRACITVCPSGAIANSSPLPSGKFPDRVFADEKRFFNGSLQFDYQLCKSERSKYTDLFPEWTCASCFVDCAVKGRRSPEAVRRFYASNP